MGNPPDAEGRLSRLILAYDEALLAGVAYDADDERDLAPELQRELAEIKRCLRLLRGPAAANAPTVADQQDPTPRLEPECAPPRALPDAIGRFQILDRLGAGGGGMVFLAFDPKLRRNVALKTPPPEYLLSTTLRQRFQREAEAAALLSHPHVVAVHEIGEVGPVSFIAAEYCAGGSLDDWLRTRTAPAPIEQAVEILLALAEGTQHAHSRGVLHRDIKPANVLFAPVAESPSPDGLPGVVKLGDFGLARIAARSDDRTRTGAILGTCAYMAPEQAQGRSDTDVRADVYALGVVLYEVLTGRPPLKGATDAETIHRVVYDDPPPPRRWRNDVPRDLEAICLRCLTKEPSGRYATADALANDLRRFQRREPIEARPLTPPQRVVRWAQRRPAWAALAAVTLVAAVALLSTVLIYGARLRNSLRRSSLYAYASLVRRASDAASQDDVEGQRDALERAAGLGPDDLRSFPWRLLARQAWGDQIDVGRHPRRAYAVAVDSAQRWIVSAGEDGVVRLWTIEGGPSAQIAAAHDGEINAIALAPDGPLLATAGADGAVRLWDLDHRRPVRTLGPWKERIATCVAFSPDGALLAAGFDDGVVRFWKRGAWDAPSETPPRPSSIRDVVFSPDSKQAAIVSKQQITIWGVAEHAELWEPHLHDEPDPAGYRTGVACFNRDGSVLATIGLKDRIARLWNVATAKEQRQIPLGEGWIHAACFSPDNRWLAIAGKRKVIWIYDWPSGTLVATLRGHVDCVRGLAFDRDGTALYSTGDDGLVKRWDFRSAMNRMRTQTLPWYCSELLITESGTMLGLSTHHGPTIVWSAGGRRPAWTFGSLAPMAPSAAAPQPLAATSEGRIWASVDRAAEHERVALLSGSDGRVVFAFEAARTPVKSLALSPDGGLLLVGIPERVQVWEVAARSLREEWPYPRSEVSSLQFVPGDPSSVLVGVNQFQTDPGRKYAELRSLRSGPVRRFEVELTERRSLALSRDGKRLAAPHRGSIVVWSIAQGRQETALRGPNSTAIALAFAPDGSLASYSRNESMLCLWDLRMAEPLHTIPVTGGQDLAFLPSGKSLLMTINREELPGALMILSAADSGAQDDPQPDTRSLRTSDQVADDARRQRADAAAEHARRSGFAAGLPSYPQTEGAEPADLLLGAAEAPRVVVEYAIPPALAPPEKTLVERMAALARYSYNHGFGGAVPWIGDSYVRCGRRGYALFPFSLQDDAAVDVERLPDGSLIAAGSAGGRCRVRGLTEHVDLAVAKLTPEGEADRSFGSAGRVQLDLGGYFEDASGLEVLGDRIVVAGVSRPAVGVDDAFVLAGLTLDGKLDERFGVSGIVRTSFVGLPSALCTDLVQDSTGRLLAAGEAKSDPQGPYRFALARYLSDGSLDPGFGDGSVGSGRVAVDFGASTSISDVKFDAQQRILAAGFVSRYPRDAPAVARYLPGGAVDELFGAEGGDRNPLWIRPVLAGMSNAHCLAILPGGRFLLGGSTCPPGSFDSLCFVARCMENGQLDPSFGAGDVHRREEHQGPPGVVTVPLGRPNSLIRDLIVQPDGRIVALANIVAPPQLALIRFLPEGRLDPTFGSAVGTVPGIKVQRLGQSSEGSTLKLDADGSLLVAGRVLQAERGYEFMVARFTPDGELDRAFGEPVEGLTVRMLTSEAAERTDIPFDELGRPETIEDRYRAVDQWAVRHGYLGGYPNWIDGTIDRRLVVGAELIRPGVGEVRPSSRPTAAASTQTGRAFDP